MDQDLTGKSKFTNPLDPGAGLIPETERSKADWTNQFYGEYIVGKLRIDSEYRRFVHSQSDQAEGIVLLNLANDVRGWYVSGAYRVFKNLKVGSYYSRYSITREADGLVAGMFPNQTDTNLPANHVYDRVITARVDFRKFWDVKLEGHFMNGYGNSTFPDGFYPQQNPQGFKPDTDALVARLGFNF